MKLKHSLLLCLVMVAPLCADAPQPSKPKIELNWKACKKPLLIIAGVSLGTACIYLACEHVLTLAKKLAKNGAEFEAFRRKI